MTENKFTEEDNKKYVEALNFIAAEAKFADSPKLDYILKARNHFMFLQMIAQKIHDNILEVKAVHQTKPEKPAPKQSRGPKK